jgi:hypothetical protein
MSVGGGIGAVEAVLQTAKQSPTDFQQAIPVVGDAKLAQSFEAGLIKASEASASSFQAVEEGRRKAIDASVRDKFEVAEATQIDVRPTEYRGDLGKGIVTYMEDFQGRTANYPQEIQGLVANVFNPDLSTGVGTKEGDLGAGDALRILQRSFQFAIEAQLVSNASHHSTQVLNDLLKGQ